MNLHDYPGLWPGLALSIVVGYLARDRLSQAFGVTRFVAWALVVGVGLIVAATLTPSYEALRFGAQGSGTCDFGRVTLAPMAEILEFGDTGLNVVLFVPLGLALGLVPRSRTKTKLIIAAVALPFAIETLQLALTSLGRTCQSADVIDNLTGLVVGLVCGTVLGAILHAAARSGRLDGDPGPG